MIIYIIYYGQNHENSLIFSDVVKAKMQLFRFTKVWHDTGYPFMLEYEDQDGIFKIRAHYIVSDKHMYDISIRYIEKHPKLLEKIIKEYAYKEHRNWWCFKRS